MTSSDNEILIKIYEGQDRILMRLDSVDRRLDKTDLRLDALEAGQRIIAARLDNVEVEQAAMKSEQRAMREEQAAFRTELNAQHSTIESLTQAMIQFDKTQEVLLHDAAHIQTSVNWIFGGIAVIAAMLGALPAIREWVKRPKYEPADYELDALARRIEQRLSVTKTPGR